MEGDPLNAQGNPHSPPRRQDTSRRRKRREPTTPRPLPLSRIELELVCVRGCYRAERAIQIELAGINHRLIEVPQLFYAP
jgi:hypothetical protein